jgi:gliding-associated putative ABC transporter substrate-binding component GldG
MALIPPNDAKAKSRANGVAFTALAIGAVVALNIVSTRLFGRLDLTEDRIFTLSPESRKLVASLPDRMTLKAYISRELPPEAGQGGVSLATTSQYVRDLLDEYATYSKGKLTWQWVDPETDPKLAQEAERNKVRKIEVYVRKTGKRELGLKYLGVSFQYQGQVESLPVITGVSGLEYEISSLIQRMAVRKKKLVFTAGQGERELAQEMQLVQQNLGNYDIATVNLSGDKPQELPADTDALIVLGPKATFTDKGRYALDQAILRGVPTAIFVDGMIFDNSQPQIPGMPPQQPTLARKNEHGLGELLSAYGVKVGDDFVFDQQVVPGAIPYQGRLHLLEYPAFVASSALAKDHPTMDHLEALVFPFASSVTLDGKSASAARPLALTTKRAWRQTGFFVLDPTRRMAPIEDRAPFPLAVAITGTLKSAYAAKAAPGETPDAALQSAAPGTTPTKKLTESAPGKPCRLVVVGDSDFLADTNLQLAQMVPIYRSNVLFFLNVIGWMTDDQTLSAARAKTVAAHPITVEDDSKGPVLAKYANIVGLPILLVLYGIFRWRVRRARRLSLRL